MSDDVMRESVCFMLSSNNPGHTVNFVSFHFAQSFRAWNIFLAKIMKILRQILLCVVTKLDSFAQLRPFVDLNPCEFGQTVLSTHCKILGNRTATQRYMYVINIITARFNVMAVNICQVWSTKTYVVQKHIDCFFRILLLFASSHRLTTHIFDIVSKYIGIDDWSRSADFEPCLVCAGSL